MSCVGKVNTHIHIQLSSTEWIQRLFVSPYPFLLAAHVFCLSNVASLSIFYRYFHTNCSSELVNCIPPPLPRSRCTRFSSQAHPYTIQIPYAGVNHYLFPFFPYTGKLWNSLPASVFPTAYDLNAFKSGVSRFICNQN